MSYSDVVAEIAPKLIDELKPLTTEAEIKAIAVKYWEDAKSQVTDGNLTRTRTALRKAVESAFPTIIIDENPTTEKPQAYYWTDTQKGHIKRYEHLALKYITTKDASEIIPEAIPEPAPVATEENFTVSNFMNITQLELDGETQKIVEDAIAHAGISLAEFVQKSCLVYAKTLLGKAQAAEADLSSISTQDLLTPKYKTHPNRAEELTRRAIYALENHNNNCTEKSQKWHINQTAIQSLTGSKPATVKEILKGCQQRLDDHNAKHDLNPYDNRKPGLKLTEVIDLVALVPNGLD